MNVVCLDLEGVLVPEIWIAFAEATNIPELKKTTRDEPDYDKLMNYRLGILKEHGLGLKEIQDVIATIDPMPGAKEFLDELRELTQVIIISDTFTHGTETFNHQGRNLQVVQLHALVVPRMVKRRIYVCRMHPAFSLHEN